MLDHGCTSTDGRPTRLTSAPGAEFGPDRSPDGEQLTYVEASNPTQRAVMIMNADGTARAPSSRSAISSSPAGNQQGVASAAIAFCASERHHDGRRVADGTLVPAWTRQRAGIGMRGADDSIVETPQWLCAKRRTTTS